MIISDIETIERPQTSRLRATVATAALSDPFELWFDLPSSDRPFVADRADPWVAALLLPAMRAGEPLEIEAPLSAELAAALPHIQTIYATWMPSALPVEVCAGDGPATCSGHAGDGIGLFFSCGVDSWYSLLRSELRRARGEPPLSHLVVARGIDIDIGTWKADVADKLVDNVAHVSRRFGLEAVAVATNVRQLYTRTGLSWRWGQAGAVAALALALRHFCGRFLVAAGATNWSIVVQPDREAGGCHPLLLPLFSAADCVLTADGSDASRLCKVATVADSQLALDTLRVCWASHEAAYNCGRCAKCVRTMVELTIVGALERCPTLAGSLDPAVIERVRVLFGREIAILRERHTHLAAMGASAEVLAALAASISRAERHDAERTRAMETVRGAIDPRQRFVLFDEDEIRFELARTHVRAVPFTERDGLYNGLPADDTAAVTELLRLRAGGARWLVVWKDCFWALEHYQEFSHHVRTRYPLVASTAEILIFDLGDRPGRPTT
jgi:hypothetical protein